MAFGDVLKGADSGSYGTTISFGTPVSAGNTILVISSCIDGNGGNVTSVSDDVNGAYTEVGVSGTFTTDTIVSKIYMLAGSASGSPTITLDSNPIRSQAFEIEGELSLATAVGTGFGTGTSVTSTSLSIPANSVSFANVSESGPQTVGEIAPWAGAGSVGQSNLSKRTDTTATTDDYSATLNSSSADGWAVVWASFTEVTTGPSITDINTNNQYTPGAANTLNGTNLSTAGGSIVVNGVTQTITNRTATAITFTGVRGGNPYNQNLTLTYTDASSNTATQTVQQVPEAGTFAVTAASPNTTDDASLWTGLIDTATSNPVTIVDGDQAWVKNPNNLTNLTVQPDGTISADQTGDFVVQIWLLSEGVWGSDQTVTFTDSVAAGPAVSTVNVPTAGSYGIGDTLSFTVNWDVSATVTGTPRLPITLATGTVYADYASGTGTTALVFSYTVQEGDNDEDGIALGAIDLNGGTIKDASTNNATLTLNGVESTVGVIVDGVRPVITIAGTNPYEMTVGETYVEQGATASDNQDGSLGSVTGTGSVDANTEGQYTITYPGAGVVDAAGNVALDVTRVVNVNAVDAWPFGKGISYAAPKTWTWGSRHPKTGMRVRIFK